MTTAAVDTTTHHLAFTAKRTTCCNRPGRDFSHWLLVINPDNVTCTGGDGLDPWTMTDAQRAATPAPF